MDKTQRGRGAIVLLARLDSRRLPGKQLLDLGNGQCALDLAIERLKRSRHGLPLILATTDREIDSPLSGIADKHGIPLFRGDLDNVAKRCLDCMDAHRLDWFVRICADSPLVDPEVVDEVINVFLETGCDLATNVFPRTFPLGTSAEIISHTAMRRICEETADLSLLEHVTLFAYQNAASFDIRNLPNSGKPPNADIRLVVDTPEDLQRVKQVISSLDAPVTASLDEILDKLNR